MQEWEPKNGYREQEAAGGTYAPKKVPELERQRQARIKRLQELERQQIELHKQRIINGTLSRRYNARAYDGLTAIVAFLTAVLLDCHSRFFDGSIAALVSNRLCGEECTIKCK